MSEYSTIQVPKSTKDKIEEYRRRFGYPSYSQAVTALVERHDVAEDIKKTLVEEMRKEITKEAINVITNQFYRLLIDVAGKVDKPISKLTVDEFVHALRESEVKRKSSVSTSEQHTP
jgi:Arc/MetJ-type ribon-helix-helix transcriptional regulator